MPKGNEKEITPGADSLDSSDARPAPERVIGRSGLTQEVAELLSLRFEVLADPTRIRILVLLMTDPHLSVGELSKKLGLSASAVSHQLSFMRHRRVVKRDKDGRHVYYRVLDTKVNAIIRDWLRTAQRTHLFD